MTLVIHPRRFKIYRKPSPEETRLLEQQLKETNLLDNDFVLLVGGILLSLCAGQYHRHHADIDLAIFETDISRFYALAKRNGYTVTERIATGHFSPLHDFSFVRPLPADRMMNSKHTRVIRHLKPFMVADRSTFLDVFVYVVNGAFVEVPRYNLRFPKERVFPILRKNLPSGLTANLPNPLHIFDIKRADRRAVNLQDLRSYAALEHAVLATQSSSSQKAAT